MIETLKLMFCSICTLFLFSCTSNSFGFALPIENGKEHKRFLIIGFGYVDVKTPINEHGATVSSQESLGIQLSNQNGLSGSVGFNSSLITEIPVDANMQLEVQKKVFQKVNIKQQDKK